MSTGALSVLLNILYLLLACLFFLDELSSFDINYQPLKTIVYIGTMSGSLFILIWNLLIVRKIYKKIAASLVPVVILLLVIIYGPMEFLFSTGAWHTQTILYQHSHSTFKKIEFQMQDVGGLGYNKRTVEVLYLTPLFSITGPVPKDIEKRVEWVKTDNHVNELHLK